MSIVNFILDLAGLLLWLNWRSLRFDPLARRTPATLMGTLRPAAPKRLRRWHLLALLAGLLVLRAVIYRWMAPFWIGKLDWGLMVTPFRSDWFGGMLMYSFLSFGITLGVFYLGLLFLSLLKGPEPVHALVKVPLGRVDDWPRWARLLLPLLGGAAAWWLAGWLFTWTQVLAPVSMAERIEQSVCIGLHGYLVWKYPAAALLGLYLLNSYIYFGRHPFWKYTAATAQTMLRPLKRFPLRLGKADFTPVLGLALIFLAAEILARGLTWVFVRLPF